MHDLSKGTVSVSHNAVDEITSKSVENSTALQLRGWRFPMSRYHLWDRQVIGERTTATAMCFFPETRISSSVFDGIRSILKDNCRPTETLPLDAEWSEGKHGSFRLSVCWSKTNNTNPKHYISCTARLPDDAGSSIRRNIVKELHTRLQDSCEDLGSCPDLSTFFAIRFIHDKSRNNERVLEGYLLVPDSTFHFSPIRMKNVCDVPLGKYLKDRMKTKDCNQPQVGYLSMDRCRRLLPLTADDPHAKEMTLVGVWVSGLTELVDPVVISMTYRFHRSAKLKDKATTNGAFLLLFYGERDYAAKLFECKVDDGTTSSVQCSLFKCRLLSGQLAKSGDLKVKWKLENSGVESSTKDADCPERSSHSDKLELLDQEKEKEHRERQSRYREAILEEIPFSFQTGDVPQRKRTRNENRNVVPKEEKCRAPGIEHPSQRNDIASESQLHSPYYSPEVEDSFDYDRNNEIQGDNPGEDIICEDRSPSLRSVDSLREGLFMDVDDIANAFREHRPGTCASVTEVSFEGFSVESSPRSTPSERLLTAPYKTSDAELHLLTNGRSDDPEHQVLCSNVPTNSEREMPQQSANPTDLKCLRLEKELSNLAQRFSQLEEQFQELKTMVTGSSGDQGMRPNPSSWRNDQVVEETSTGSLAIVPSEDVHSEDSFQFNAPIQHLKSCSLEPRTHPLSLTFPLESSTLGASQLLPCQVLDLTSPDFEEDDEDLERLIQKYLPN